MIQNMQKNLRNCHQKNWAPLYDATSEAWINMRISRKEECAFRPVLTTSNWKGNSIYVNIDDSVGG